jgi:hypothetical protein
MMTKRIAIVFACGATLATAGLQARRDIGVMRARIQCLEQKTTDTAGVNTLASQGVVKVAGLKGEGL